MSEKFLKVGINGEYEEALGYLTSEFINSSAGAADAGKPIVLDSNGEIDASMINFGAIDHGSLSGLGDDDHTQYSLVDGTRAYTGVVAYNAHPSFNNDLQLVDKKYVDDVAATLEWQDSVLDADILDPTALSPSTGDRYLINGVGAGAWAGQDNNIAEYNGTGWDYTSPTTGMRVGADDEPNVAFYLYGGSSWEAKNVESTTASTGLTKVGYDIQLDASAAGAGIGFAAGVLSANVDDSSIEIDTDTLRVKALGITNAMLAGSISDDKLLQDYIQTSEVDDVTIEFAGGNLNVKADGINDTHIDFGTGLNQVNAQDIPILDGGNYTDESTAEGAIQELYQLIDQRGVEYTAGTGGISKGDLCYISSNDTVLPYSSITAFQKAIGIASTTEAAAAQVKVLGNDTVVAGILSSTAGTVQYWDGSGHVGSIPSTSGAYVVQTGVAKNATDLSVEVRLIKKNI
jgi:hypothetical protein